MTKNVLAGSKLFYLPTSPFSRKVRVLAIESGLSEEMQLVHAAANASPLTPDHHVVEENPLGEIPTLVLADGDVICDSRVICEFLDTLHNGTRMLPPGGHERWRILSRQTIADGILDAAVATRYELILRPKQYQWSTWINAQKQKLRRALGALEVDIKVSGETLDMGVITLGCALGYLDFRYPDEGWRNEHPFLAEWYEKFASRKSMQETRPD